MTNPVEQLPRTALASTGWKDSSNHVQLRVYFQDKTCVIREALYEGNGWKLGGVIAKDARLNTPIAVTSWLGDDKNVRIRVYYLSVHNTILEMCCDPGSGPNFWNPGALNKSNVKANPTSQLTAIRWLQDRTTHINVYFQRDDNMIQEFRYMNDKWFVDKTLNKGLTGTSLSAIVFGDGGKGIRVYYQDPKLNLLESAWDSSGGWTAGGFRKAGPGYTPIAAITWGKTPDIRVYTITSDANIVEYEYSGASWGGPRLIGHSNPGSFLAALTFTPDQANIRVYYIEETDQIKEVLWSGTSWAPGSVVPTGALQ